MKKLTEEDVKNRHITPAIEKSGWAKDNTWMEYSFTDGQVIVRGNVTKRGKRKKADYLLNYQNNLPLAIVEAKDNSCALGDGMQQAIDYASILDIPFAYSSNGLGFLEHDRLTGKETELALNAFPSPNELWERKKQASNYTQQQEDLLLEPYYVGISNDRKPRYYQRIAINRTIEAIAKGEDRILLVMATGTGKTFTAFQIIWRLLKAKKKKKVLYLADRNILIDQTMQQDFKPFEKIITKVKAKNLDSSYEVYMSLYHQLAGDENEEPFREFQPEFFDLIIVDECHRGSAKEDSKWRRILEYFSGSTQIGLTATPKETKEISNSSYFGDPIYTYSLKEGIDDGFLAPYKVVRVGIDKDLEGYRPVKGQLDVDGEEIEDREYNSKDYDRTLIIDDRTLLVAKRISEWLKKNDPFAKTIVFCIDIDHAERMRQALVNENSEQVQINDKYVMRITGDNDIGKAQLDYFIDPWEKYPVIVTTSKLMTTGVDCKTCKLIVLDSNINSMTEFKQTIGRGTRLFPEQGKEFFTIMDFRDACRLFADPEFDGDPVVITDVVDGEEIIEPEPSGTTDNPIPDYPTPDGGDEVDVEKKKKRRIRGIDVQILNERVQYYDKAGKLITESIIDFSKKNIKEEYATLDDFLTAWNAADKKQAIIEELENKGVLFEYLESESKTKNLDPFDLILHIAYDKKPLTRTERINNVKKRDFLSKYEGLAKEVIDALLEKYMNEGINELESTLILKNPPFDRMGSAQKIAALFGGKKEYLNTIKKITAELYAA